MQIICLKRKEVSLDLPGGSFVSSKARLSCQNPLGLSSRERGRYDLQMITFGGTKNEGNIADTHAPGALLFIKSDYPNWWDKM
jgi:hypothetical protein